MSTAFSHSSRLPQTSESNKGNILWESSKKSELDKGPYVEKRRWAWDERERQQLLRCVTVYLGPVALSSQVAGYVLRGIKHLSKQRKAYTLLVLVYHAGSLLPLCVPGRAGIDRNSDDSIRVKGRGRKLLRKRYPDKSIDGKIESGRDFSTLLCTY